MENYFEFVLFSKGFSLGFQLITMIYVTLFRSRLENFNPFFLEKNIEKRPFSLGILWVPGGYRVLKYLAAKTEYILFVDTFFVDLFG